MVQGSQNIPLLLLLLTLKIMKKYLSEMIIIPERQKKTHIRADVCAKSHPTFFAALFFSSWKRKKTHHEEGVTLHHVTKLVETYSLVFQKQIIGSQGLSRQTLRAVNMGFSLKGLAFIVSPVV